MKILVKTKLLYVPMIKNFFVEENGFQIIKDLISADKVESGGTSKFIVLDIGNIYANISLFNKVNEQKLNVMKIDLSIDAVPAIMNNCKTLLEFNKTPIGIDSTGVNLFVCPEASDDNKASISNDVWYKFIEYKSPSFPIFMAKDKLADFPKSKLLHGKTAFAIFDFNYSFCEEDDSSKRETFSTIAIYSSNSINDLFFAKIADVVKEFRDKDISASIYNELVSPTYDAVIKKLRGKEDEIFFVGLKDEADNIVWLPLADILQYMDMPSDIFFSCIDKLQDKKTVLSYEVPSLDQFTSKIVHNLEIRLEKATILFTFANILNMKEPAYNLTTQKFENLNDYEFYQD